MTTVTQTYTYIRDMLRNSITDTNSKRTTTVTDEEHTYATGTSKYALTNSSAQGISSVTGTVGAGAYTFTWLTDFYLGSGADSGKIVFCGTKPDDGTKFLVSYPYGQEWIALNRTRVIPKKPYIQIWSLFDEHNGFIGAQDVMQDCNFQVDIIAGNNTELNSIKEAVITQITENATAITDTKLTLKNTTYIIDEDFIKISLDIIAEHEG